MARARPPGVRLPWRHAEAGPTLAQAHDGGAVDIAQCPAQGGVPTGGDTRRSLAGWSGIGDGRGLGPETAMSWWPPFRDLKPAALAAAGFSVPGGSRNTTLRSASWMSRPPS